MSQFDMNDIDLRAAIPDTPDMCREAVLHAASTYREEKAMWRPSKMILAAALIVTLLCGTAYAIVSYYSVRDYVAEGKTSAAFEENIIPLEKTVTTNGLSFTLGDAVFDGKDLAFTMNLTANEDIAPLYIWPTLQAFCGEDELDVEFMGNDMLGYFGMLLPNLHPEIHLLGTGEQGAQASLYMENPVGEVTWRYTVFLYKPTGELVQAREWDEWNESHEEWEEYLRTIHADGKIGVSRGASILDYVNAVNVDAQSGSTFGERILRTGLFELADAVVFEFTTAVPEKKLLASDVVFELDGNTVTVTSLTQSFMQVDYALTVVFDEPYMGHEHSLEQFYNLLDQNGMELPRRGATLTLADDRLSCTFVGSAGRISDEPLTSLTFVLDPVEWPEGKALPTFTVDLTK